MDVIKPVDDLPSILPERLTAIGSQLVDEQIFCTSLQIAVDGPNGAGYGAFGHIAPGVLARNDHLFSVHCATKPLLPLAVGILIDRGLIDPDAPVCHQVTSDCASFELSADVWAVLNHSARLADPRLVEVNMTPIESREHLARRGIRVSTAGYSEYTGQVALADLVATTSVTAAGQFIREKIIDTLGLSDHLFLQFSRAEIEDRVEQIGYYVRGLPVDPIPIVNDWSPHLACIDRTCLGGYTSAMALGHLYKALGRVYEGESVAGLPTTETLRLMLQHRSTRQLDPILQRTCSFAGGFMVDLSDHGYGPAPCKTSFGHTGVSGASFAMYDPDSRVACAVISNGLHSNPDDLDNFRSRLVTAIIDSAS